MIHVRQNGKFFSEPFQAKTQQDAFTIFVNELIAIGAIGIVDRHRIIDRSFKQTLMPADDLMGSFMWDRAVAAEENDMHIIFSVYDYGGWRFFGRI